MKRLFCWLTLLVWAQSAWSSPKAPLIAVVMDADLPAYLELQVQLARALDQRLPGHTSPSWRISGSHQSGQGSLSAALNLFYEDEEVDLILVIGPIATRLVLGTQPEKPVICALLQDPDLFGISYNEFGRSGRPNINFVGPKGSVQHDLQALAELRPGQRIRMVLDLATNSELNWSGKEKVQPPILVATDSAEPLIHALSGNSDPVYLGLCLQLPLEERERLFSELARRRTPVFAMAGLADVEAGAFATLANDTGQTLVRRLTANLEAALNGATAGDLPCYLPRREQLTLNGKTAVALGVAIDLDTRIKADILHLAEVRPGSPISLTRAMEQALKDNAEVSMARDEVTMVEKQEKMALSALLPRISSQTTYAENDPDRGDVAAGLSAETSTTLNLKASQKLFDDVALTRYRSGRKQSLGQEQSFRAMTLETRRNTALIYLNMARAQALLDIEIRNLKLTRANLETARNRLSVGAGGREEVLRWESEEARQQGSVRAASARNDQSKLAFNRLLGQPASQIFYPQENSPEDRNCFGPQWARWLQDLNPETTRQLLDLAISHSPSLAALDAATEAGSMNLAQLKRSFVLPTLQADFSYDSSLDATYSANGLFPPLDESWSARITATLPLFLGGERAHAIGRARAETNRIKTNRVREQQLLEQSLFSALAALQGSYPNLSFSEVAADRARQNLEIVVEKYALGQASILELLDAQNRSFLQEQQMTLAIFDYREDLVDLQRALSWYAICPDSESQQQWFQQFGQSTDSAKGVSQ